MRRFSTLTILAIFSPVMCLIAFVVFSIAEVVAAHRRSRKYHSGLPRAKEHAMALAQADVVGYMIEHNVTPTEYAARLREGRL